jgi:pSer/pThr/pTyr-binding forkhead associated (FHA) protein
MARLVVLSEGLTGRTYELKAEKTTIGRVEDNSFQIAEPSVSSHHCEILLRGNDVVVKDLNSTNGTFINGQPVTEEKAIKPGQILRLGQIEMRLESGEPKPAAKKLPDQTMVIPQGINLSELDKGTRPVAFEKDSQFHRKSDTGTKLFIAVAIFFGIVIAAFIVYAILKSQQIAP